VKGRLAEENAGVVLLESLERTLQQEPPQFIPEERHLVRPPPRQNASVRRLRKSLHPPRDRDRDDRDAVDERFVDRVSTRIPGVAKRPHDRIERALVQLATNDSSIVSDADEDHSAVGVRKRNDRILKGLVAGAGLELDEVALARDLGIELLAGQALGAGGPDGWKIGYAIVVWP